MPENFPAGLSWDKRNSDLFSVVKLLSILGDNRYDLTRWSSSSRSERTLFAKLLAGLILSLPAIIEVTPFSLGGNFSSLIFSEISKLLAALLAGAGVTNLYEVIRTALRPKSLTIPGGSAQREAEIVRGAILLKQLVPDSVAEEISKRVRICWARYNKLLEGDYLPEEIERGTEQLKSCICKEVLRLEDLNGGQLPESPEMLHDYLLSYRCHERTRETI